jgi:hypothetical protein
VATDPSDPSVSAIVALHPAEGEQGAGTQDFASIAKVKAHFTQAGFEVHAPLRRSFSIGARRSKFEDYFGTRLVVEEEDLFGAVTTEDGKPELSLDPLPDDLRPLVQSVTFPPSPDLKSG